MMPQEWPIAQGAERSEPARVAGPGRLRTVRADFFLNPAERLTEQERALMTAMLHCLVADIAAEIRALLPSGWAGANEDEPSLVSILSGAGLLNDAELVALLLRRADEERIATASKSRSGRGDARSIQGFVSHHNAEVAAAAMSLVLARGRRRDRFGQCLLGFDDLSSECAGHLVYAVAAALRKDAVAAQGAAAADFELTRAAAGIIAKHQGRGIDSLMASLVSALDQAGALGDDLLLACAQEGEIGFLAEVVGRRAGLPGNVTFDELLSGDEHALMAILRLAGTSRSLCAGILATLGDLLGIDDPGAAIETFESMSSDDLQAAASWLAAPAGYRSAYSALGGLHG